MKHIESDHLIKNYSIFLVDLWGTVHDGIRLIDGISDFLEKSIKSGVSIIFLTNSPRSKCEVSMDLENKFSIKKGVHYHDIVTSGELALDTLRERNLFEASCLIGSGHIARSIINEANLNLIRKHDPDDFADEDFAKADFIFESGFNDGDHRAENIRDKFREFLQKGLKYNLPMLCSNPDRRVMHGNDLVLCAGELSLYYSEMGGEVWWCGKPYNLAYEKSISTLQKLLNTEEIDKKQITAIGDNLDTDIHGGIKFGIDAFMVTFGIHSLDIQEIKNTQSLGEEESHFELFRRYQVKPTGMIKSWF